MVDANTLGSGPLGRRSRADCFPLRHGCALEELNLLEQVNVVSAVSGEPSSCGLDGGRVHGKPPRSSSARCRRSCGADSSAILAEPQS